MRVTVVSPHLDDAVLSVGGTIHGLTRRGTDVTIATIFAGDPQANSPASYWDAARGDTQGEAVRERRQEDEDAAAMLGASAVALPWPDSGYVGHRDPDAIWVGLAPYVQGADVTLLPGWPLQHADHRYAALLVLERIAATAPVVFYAEHPYAAEPATLLKAAVKHHIVAPLRHAYGADIRWARHRLDPASAQAQQRAVQCYAGELVNLGIRGRWGGLYRRGAGEWLGVGQRGPIPQCLGLT
jgi:LmbE family N-acetylglucosaminyl deacetylase